MEKINGKSIIAQYFKRSYFALDGIWFVMVEKNFSLEEALRIDEEVWKVFPKIQAREVKKLLNLKKNTFSNFLNALKIKLEAEDYHYQERITGKNLSLLIKKRPWYEIIKKSQRLELQLNEDVGCDCCFEKAKACKWKYDCLQLDKEEFFKRIYNKIRRFIEND